jgi:hypothetical protein
LEVAHEICERAVAPLGIVPVCHDKPPFDVRSDNNRVGPSARPIQRVIEAHEITPPMPLTARYFQVEPPLLDLRMSPPRLLLMPSTKQADTDGQLMELTLVTIAGKSVADQLNPPLIVRTSTSRFAECLPIPTHTIALKQERSRTRATDGGKE